ncbi:MAG: aldehyde dehydrogenase family protein [Massilistercora timonensis]|uniref:aldehyde dehydrogenase family protein n=1 Tax=Massilistercora timonensis TaxID=2086584 RepID=UPI002F9C977E
MDPMKYVRKETYQLFINGKRVTPEKPDTFQAINPVNNEPFATIYKAGEKETNMAIAAAREAFDHGPWGKMSCRERSDLLYKAAELLQERLEEFAAVETLECGKLYGSAYYYDGDKSVDALKYFAGLTRCLKGEIVPIDHDTVNLVQWYPHGVVGEILPWNGPFMMGCQKIGSILAAGNTCVVKPSSWGSLTMLMFAELLTEAGFPDGVVNVVTGSGRIVGDALVKSEDVDMVAMTGGTETGKAIIASSSSTVKDIALELGGKSPNIVFDDVDVDEVVKWAKFAFTLNSGEVCVSGTRLILQRNIYEEFLEKLKKECENVVPGDGFDPNVTLSALIHKEHCDEVWQYIESGKEQGARLICGGEHYTDPELAKGNFVPITVFADVTPDMKIFQEEIFGPVLCVTPFDTEEEAIEIANSTKFGLAGGVFTKDMKKGLRVAQAVKGGQIYVNSYFSQAMVESPGTGWKQSGIGVAGIKKYMISKTIFLNTKDGYVPY